MKALIQTAPGEPAEVLKLIDIEDPQPGPGDVLIDVLLSSVHHGDLAMIRSLSVMPEGDDHVRRGSEAVGIVRALGTDAGRQGNLNVGDRVIGFPAMGAWAQRVVVPASAAIPVPPELGDEAAAQLMVNYATARIVMRGLRKSVVPDALGAGVVLVTGASTVVGRLLLHFLQTEGLSAVGLTRSRASANRVATELANAQVVATDGGDWRARVTEAAAGKKIVGVLDCVFGPLLGELAPLLANDAAIVTYGALGGHTLGIGAPALVNRQFVIRGVVFVRWFSDLSPEEQAQDIRSAIALAGEQPLLFKTAAVHGLAEFRQAIASVEAQDRDGFVFVKP